MLDELVNNTNGTCPPQAACLSVRYADIDDLETVLEMYMNALEEIKDNVSKPDPDNCRKVVYFSWSQAPCVLLEKAGEIIGFAGLKTVVPEYSKEVTLREYMWFIQAEHRSYQALKKISDSCQAVADKFKLPLYMSHMIFDMNLPMKERVLKRWGYKPMTIEVKYE